MIVVFVVPLVALLIARPIIWCEEHLWNVNVLQRVHLYSLVFSTVGR
jgi:hypothetical protein